MIMSLKNLISRIHNKLAIEADAFLWHRSVKALRFTSIPEAKKVILICDLMTMIASVKVQTLYAARLRLSGYRTVVLLRDPAPFLERLYKSAIPDVEFCYLTIVGF